MPACVIAGDGDRRRLRRACASVPAGSIALARPKSSTFTVPSGRDLDVGGLQIAVDDALLVRRFERLGDLLRDRQRLVERNRAARDPLRQSSPSTSSITSACMPPDLFEPVDARRCWDDSARRASSASRWKRASRSASAANDVRQHLDRHLALQLGVGRAIHLAHAACADLGGDLMDAESGAGREGH